MGQTAGDSEARAELPPVLSRLLSGTFFLALRTPLQAIFALWSVPLILNALGPESNGAYWFAWSFGFLQFLLEFGMSSALQRQISEAWTKGDRDSVDRGIACGMTFYTATAALQFIALLSIAYIALPQSKYAGSGEPYRLIVKLLWLQACTAPCYGISVVVSSVLQAARRYDFIPRFEMVIVIVRFLILALGISAGVDFFWIVILQTLAGIGLALGPSLYVMVRELGYIPRFRGARLSDYGVLLHTSFFLFLMQLSVVLATSIDTTILAYALPSDPGPATTIYNNVSKPFLQLRQTGWMLAYLVMPAVASLTAAGDREGLEKIKYDGPRLHTGLLLPVGLLAWIHAGPFLELWVGAAYREYSGLMRLFLIGALPLLIAVQVQAVVGMKKVEVVSLAALGGSLINLPLSWWLTKRMGVSGVIWGTVLTTLPANLIVPGYYVFKELAIEPARYFRRTLAAPLAGAAAIAASAWCMAYVVDPGAASLTRKARIWALACRLCVSCLAYAAGYALVPAGRGDFRLAAEKLRNRTRGLFPRASKS